MRTRTRTPLNVLLASGLALTLIGCTKSPEPPDMRIPERFIGEWNTELKDCGTGDNDSRLRIESERVRFHESSGTVQTAAVEADDTLALIAEFKGEGQTWLGEHRFRLSDDGQSLSERIGARELVRRRCP